MFTFPVDSLTYKLIGDVEKEQQLALINKGSAPIEVFIGEDAPSEVDEGYIIDSKDRAYILIGRGNVLYARYHQNGGPSALLVTPRVAEHPGVPRQKVQQEGLIANTFQLKFYKDRVSQTLAADLVQDERVVTFTSGHGIVVGQSIEFTDPDGGFMLVDVVEVNGDDVTIDSPSVRTFTVQDTVVSSRNSDLRVDGSITPQVFSVRPAENQAGELHKITISITGGSAMDFTKFGSANALVNGILVRKLLPDGSFLNLFKAKTNGDLIEVCNQFNFLEKSGGGEYAFIGKYEPPGHNSVGVIIPIEGRLGEEIEVVIQDDLSGLSGTFNILGEGLLY